MRIGILSSWTVSGAGEVSLAFAKVLVDQGNHVSVYSRYEPDWPKLVFSHERFRLIEGKPTTSPLLKSVNLRHFRRWLEQNNFDVVIFNEQVSLEPVIMAKNMKIKCVAYVDYYREDTIRSFELYDALICVTKRHHKVFDWHPNAWFLPWGIDLRLYQLPLGDDKLKAYPFFHSCGPTPKRKGTDILLRALECDRSLNCTIHAVPSLESTLPEMSSLIKLLKLRSQLVEINTLTPQPGLYNQGNIYVYPSRLDGLGLSVLEACSAGLYLITTDYEPMKDFAIPSFSTLVPVSNIRCRSDGYYWPITEVDPEVLARKMSEVISNWDSIKNYKLKSLSYVQENRELYKNFLTLTNNMQKLKHFSPEASSQSFQLEEYPFSKFPIKYSNILIKLYFFLKQQTILSLTLKSIKSQKFGLRRILSKLTLNQKIR
jgi:1,2-diacylglycerol 3-alpha-glucosyltransferase